MTIRFTFFATGVGPCAIAWSDAGVAGVLLPDRDEAALRARLTRRFSEAMEAVPPPAAANAIAAIVALTGGEPRDLGFIDLGMRDVPAFDRRVYEIARTVASGATITYGEIARRMGEPSAAQAVGKALGRNPFAIIVPCHRVLGADGKAGGFSAYGGLDTKLRLLSIERARTADDPGLFADLPLSVRPRRHVASAG